MLFTRPPNTGGWADNCDLHSGKIEIKSELLRAITLGTTIQPRHLLADQAKLEGFFRRTFSGTGWRAA